MSNARTGCRASARASFPVLAILFVAGQLLFPQSDDPSLAVDRVKVVAWLVWAVALLFLLAGGGALFGSKRVRALMDDETTRANRNTAYAMGFWLAVGSALGLYILTIFEAVDAREAIHIMLTAAVAGALLTFAKLERHALRDG